MWFSPKRFLVVGLHFTLFTVAFPYLLYAIVSDIAVFLPFAPPSLGWVRYPLGLGLVFLGVWIMLCAEVDLSRYGGGGGPFPFYNQPRRLVREGIYSCTRNPMYLGTTVEYCGVGLLMD